MEDADQETRREEISTADDLPCTANTCTQLPTPQPKGYLHPLLGSRSTVSLEMPGDAEEKPIAFQSDSTRRRILLSYLIVFIVGIPLWWVTTSLTRLPLPEARVKALEPRKVSNRF